MYMLHKHFFSFKVEVCTIESKATFKARATRRYCFCGKYEVVVCCKQK